MYIVSQLGPVWLEKLSERVFINLIENLLICDVINFVEFMFTFGGFRFYTECLGMKLLRKRDIPEEKYTNAFLGYGPEDSHFVIELTYSKDLTTLTMTFLLKCAKSNLLDDFS